MEYKDETTRIINGITVKSRTLIISSEEEEEVFAKIKKLLVDGFGKDKTA